MLKNELKLPFYLAFQSLRRGRKWTLFLTVFLMAVAFINLIFVSALFAGIVAGSNQQVVDTLTGNVYMTPKQGQASIKDASALKHRIAARDKVQYVASTFQMPAMLEKGSRAGHWGVFATNPDEYAKVFNVKDKMYAGSYLNPDDTDGILIGRQIAGGEKMELNSTSLKGVNPGDKLTVDLDGRKKTFTVRGIFYTKFVQADSRAFITDKALLKLMPQTANQATEINIKTGKADENAVLKDVEGMNLNTDSYLWTESAGLMKSVSASFVSINIIMTIVGTVIAGVTTFIVIYVDIINRRRQIGILRAIGIRPYIIVANYVLLAVVYAVLGILLGTLIFFAVLVPYFQIHPFSLPLADAVLNLSPMDYFVRLEIISWAALVSGLVPALLVTRTKMIHAIKGR